MELGRPVMTIFFKVKTGKLSKQGWKTHIENPENNFARSFRATSLRLHQGRKQHVAQVKVFQTPLYQSLMNTKIESGIL